MKNLKFEITCVVSKFSSFFDVLKLKCSSMISSCITMCANDIHWTVQSHVQCSLVPGGQMHTPSLHGCGKGE